MISAEHENTTLTAAFPADAYDRSFTIYLRSVTQPPGRQGGAVRLGTFWALEAVDNFSGQPISQLARSFTLTLTYHGADWESHRGGRWAIFAWDTGQRRWVALPTTQVSDGVFEVTFDRLTTFGLMGIEESRLFLPHVTR